MKEYIRNKATPTVVKCVEDSADYIRTGEWEKATEADYEKAQSKPEKRIRESV